MIWLVRSLADTDITPSAKELHRLQSGIYLKNMDNLGMNDIMQLGIQ